MKRIVLCMLVVFLCQPVWSQSDKKSKEKEETKTEKKSGKDDKEEKKDKDKDKDKEKGKSGTKTASAKTKSAKPSPSKSASDQRGRGRKTAPVTIVNFYYDLPLKYLPSLRDYMKKMNASGSGYVRKDSKEFRSEFIRQQNLEKDFLQLQMPGETQVARFKMYKPEEGKSIIAVETTDCNPYCVNRIRFYRKDTGKWKNVTEEYMVELDRKEITKRLESKYKSHYLDLKIYESRNYQDSASFRNAIIYAISPDEDKIIISEQYLPMPLYEMIWDPKKARFNLKKL